MRLCGEEDIVCCSERCITKMTFLADGSKYYYSCYDLTELRQDDRRLFRHPRDIQYQHFVAEKARGVCLHCRLHSSVLSSFPGDQRVGEHQYGINTEWLSLLLSPILGIGLERSVVESQLDSGLRKRTDRGLIKDSQSRHRLSCHRFFEIQKFPCEAARLLGSTCRV